MKLEAKQRLQANELSPKQKAIDFNDNGKVDGDDLKKLRDGKKPVEAAPTFTKLFQLSADIVKHEFKDNPSQPSVKKVLVKAFNAAANDVGMTCMQNAERFLQNDASSATWSAACKMPSAFKNLCAYVEAFEINYEELT
jgi:hypothetical protein